MSAQPRALVAGNWKMNGIKASFAEADAVAKAVEAATGLGADVMICPPTTILGALSDRLAGTRVSTGAQDCHPNESGAHTGDVSAEMIRDVGGTASIVGHSERRADHGEENDEVRDKAAAAHRAGLTAIICIGETEAQRRNGETLDVVRTQLMGSLPDGATSANTVIAYEPVWAIGTGLTPTPEDVAEVHDLIRGLLVEKLGADGENMRILYGGSVKPSNAAELMGVSNVNGALVGGASLKADDFLGIISVYGD